jgi:RNA polymerase-binding transcription factor DksA
MNPTATRTMMTSHRQLERASDLDGTDIRDDGEPLSTEPMGSCDECGVNIYEENLDTGLCDQCEFMINSARPRRTPVAR